MFMSGWRKAQDILLEALERDTDERDQFLQSACHGDETLRIEVEALLAAEPTIQSTPTRPVDDSTCRCAYLGCGELLASRFRIVRFIASGGMGDVYEAEDRHLGERIALKTIRPGLAANPHMLARFKTEIQLAKRISHPNVCRIHDLGMDERPSGRIAFLTMELLGGQTLARHLKENRLGLEEVHSIAAQMAAGLDAAHKAQVIHRDLKTSNVVLIREGSQFRAVITDFGIARTATGDCGSTTLTKTGGMVGTPDYMAPEQVRGGPISPETDIYALGIVLFEMVTGRLPFSADTPIGSAVKRLQEPPPCPRLYSPKLPKTWEVAILRCLEVDPAARFQSAGDLIRFLETNRVPARGRALPVSTAHRSSIRIVAIAALLVCLSLWIFLRRSSGPTTAGEGAAPPANRSSETARVHYERGLYFWNLRTQEAFLRAIEEYKRAIEADPKYAGAYSGLALVYAMQSGFKSPAQVFPTARTYAEEAIRLNDKLAQAHAALAFVKFYYDWDWKDAEKEFKRAVQLDPSYASAHSNYAVLLAVRNRFGEAGEQARLAEKADPVSAAVATGLGRIYYWSGQYSQAIEQFQAVLSMHPQFTEARLSLASALDATGNADGAVRQISYVLSDTLDSSALAHLGSIYAKMHDTQLARAMLLRLEKLRTENKRYLSPCYPAIVYAALGEKDKAFNLLNQGLKERTFEMVYLKTNQDYSTLRTDRRWQKLTRAVGLE
jgi:serine/threonine protein kinase/tetratricopeptide (TPR) repeat protein